MDWSKSTKDQRKSLYQVIKRIADEKGDSVDDIFNAAIGYQMSSTYISTLRDGRFSSRNSVKLFAWLEQQYPSRAAELIQNLSSDTSNVSEQGWYHFIKRHTQTNNLEILPRNKYLEIVGISRNQSNLTVELGDEFYLRYQAPAQGYLAALQSYENNWYVLPLCADRNLVSVKVGENLIPMKPDTQEIDYLSEVSDYGDYEFVTIFQTDNKLLNRLANTKLETAISLDDLNQLALQLEQDTASNFLIDRQRLHVKKPT